MIVTERMVAAALLAEAHVPDSVDMITRQKMVMRSSIMAALAVMPVEGEDDRSRLAREIGERVLQAAELERRALSTSHAPEQPDA